MEWGHQPRATEICLLLSADHIRLLELQVTQMCCFKPQNIVALYAKAGVLKYQLWQSKQSSNVSVSQCPTFMGKESTHQESKALTGERLPTASVETQTWQGALNRTKAKSCTSARGQVISRLQVEGVGHLSELQGQQLSTFLPHICCRRLSL